MTQFRVKFWGSQSPRDFAAGHGSVHGEPATRQRHWAARWHTFLGREQGVLFGWVPVIIGAGAAVYFAILTEPSGLIAGLVLSAALLFAWLVQVRSGLRALGFWLALFALGFVAAKLRTEMMRAPVLDRPLGLVAVTGVLEKLEAQPARGGRLTLRPTHIEKVDANALPYRVRVRTKGSVDGLSPGQTLELSARLSPPPPPALPGGFDFARHAWFQGIGAVGFSMRAPKTIPTAAPLDFSVRFAAAIQQTRHAIASRLRVILPGQSGAIAIALVTGERGGISEDTNQIYRDAGLFHILSISGMHMAIMAGAVFFLIRLLFAAVPFVALNLATKKWAAFIAALAALGYLALSGGAFATVRSYIMISVMFGAVLLDRPALALRNVAVAACIILVIFPESVLDPGFQMSFAAVLALVSVYEALRKTSWGASFADAGLVRRLFYFFIGIVISTLVAGLAVAPFAAYHFHTTQHLAVLANLIAMPVSNLIIMPAALGVLVLFPFGLEWPAAVAMGFGIDMMTETADWVAHLPGAVGRIASVPAEAFALIVFGGLWLILWRTRWRAAGVLAIVGGLVLVPTGQRPDILIGNKAKTVAVRGADGLLHPVKMRGRLSFETKRWLEADGQDPRSYHLINNQTEDKPARHRSGLRCDGVGCIGSLHGLTLAVATHASALRDDCRVADILVFNDPRPKGCDRPRALIDFFDVYYGGTHAIFIEDGLRLRIESVAGVRGTRPWTKTLPGRDRQRQRRSARQEKSGSRLNGASKREAPDHPAPITRPPSQARL